MSLADDVRSGRLIPVEVFGSNDDCPKCGGEACQWGFGLSDRFSEYAIAGSDCNRAEFFLLRPGNEELKDPELRAAIRHVLDVGEEFYKDFGA